MDLELLVDDGDTQRWGIGRLMQRLRLAIDEELAFIGLHDPADDPDQRRFARAVLAQDPVDLAWAQVEVHSIKGTNTGIVLGDTAELEDRRMAGGRHDRSSKLRGGSKRLTGRTR